MNNMIHYINLHSFPVLFIPRKTSAVLSVEVESDHVLSRYDALVNDVLRRGSENILW